MERNEQINSGQGSSFDDLIATAVNSVEISPEMDALTDTTDQQRTSQWYADRLKTMVTGSKLAKVMGVNGLGKTGEKYLFSRFMEIETGKAGEQLDLITYKYGRMAEPAIIQLAAAECPEFKKHKPCGFIAKNDLIGASPDGFVGKIPCEMKAATKWDKFFDRVVTPYDMKHLDFWQTEAEMYVADAHALYYVTAEPPKIPIWDIVKGNLSTDEIVEQIGRVHIQILHHDDMAIEMMEARLQECKVVYDGYRERFAKFLGRVGK